MTDSPISAKQLQRLADVADMHRTGAPIWIAISDEDLTEEVVVGPDEAAVREEADGLLNYTVHGPFQTSADTEWGSEIVKVEVTTRTAKGEERTMEVDLDRVDALFLTQSATEKFAMPYLTERYGPEFASDWWAEFTRTRKDHGGFCCHLLSLIGWVCPEEAHRGKR